MLDRLDWQGPSASSLPALLQAEFPRPLDRNTQGALQSQAWFGVRHGLALASLLLIHAAMSRSFSCRPSCETISRRIPSGTLLRVLSLECSAHRRRSALPSETS